MHLSHTLFRIHEKFLQNSVVFPVTSSCILPQFPATYKLKINFKLREYHYTFGLFQWNKPKHSFACSLTKNHSVGCPKPRGWCQSIRPVLRSWKDILLREFYFIWSALLCFCRQHWRVWPIAILYNRPRSSILLRPHITESNYDLVLRTICYTF